MWEQHYAKLHAKMLFLHVYTTDVLRSGDDLNPKFESPSTELKAFLEVVIFGTDFNLCGSV